MGAIEEKGWKRSWHFENDTLKLRSYLRRSGG